MTQKELLQWNALRLELNTKKGLIHWDYGTLLRLNHLVMEEAHKIHNDNMLRKDK